MVAGPRTTSPSASRKVLPCQGQVTQSWRICRRPAVRPCECRWHRSPGRRHLGGKQDRHPRSVDLPGRAVGRIRHGAHLCPRVWSRGPGGVVDVDGLDEGEVSAEVTADKQGCASPVAYQQGLSVLRNSSQQYRRNNGANVRPCRPPRRSTSPPGTYSDASPVSWGCGQRGLGQRSTGNRTGYGFRFGTGGHRRVTVDGIDTFYRESGPADGPVVLLPHGYPCSSYAFLGSSSRKTTSRGRLWCDSVWATNSIKRSASRAWFSSSVTT